MEFLKQINSIFSDHIARMLLFSTCRGCRSGKERNRTSFSTSCSGSISTYTILYNVEPRAQIIIENMVKYVEVYRNTIRFLREKGFKIRYVEPRNGCVPDSDIFNGGGQNIEVVKISLKKYQKVLRILQKSIVAPQNLITNEEEQAFLASVGVVTAAGEAEYRGFSPSRRSVQELVLSEACPRSETSLDSIGPESVEI